MRPLILCLLLPFTAFLVATAVGFAMQAPSRGLHSIRPQRASVAHTFRVPPGATTFQATACDSDLIFDDVLAVDDWENIPEDDDGNTVDQLTIIIDLFCSDGLVYGSEGSSGESSAEVYIKVQWNNGNGSDECTPQSVCCWSSVAMDSSGN